MKISILIQYYYLDKNQDRFEETINITKNTASKDYLEIVKKELKKVRSKYERIIQAAVTTISGIPLFLVNSCHHISLEDQDNDD